MSRVFQRISDIPRSRMFATSFRSSELDDLSSYRSPPKHRARPLPLEQLDKRLQWLHDHPDFWGDETDETEQHRNARVNAVQGLFLRYLNLKPKGLTSADILTLSRDLAKWDPVTRRYVYPEDGAKSGAYRYPRRRRSRSGQRRRRSRSRSRSRSRGRRRVLFQGL